MINYKNNFIYETYLNKVITKNKNIAASIADRIINGINYFDMFGNSQIINQLISTYQDSIEYRKNKSNEQKKIKDYINNNFLNNIKLPFDIKKIEAYIQIEPNRKENYSIGGYLTPDSVSGIIITVNGIITDKEKFYSELMGIIVHEMVHWRQLYDSKLKNEIIQLPKMTIGSKPNTIEMIEKEFKNYLLNPLELEAYATEYNYRNNNILNKNRLKTFSNKIFHEIFGKPNEFQDEKIRQTISHLFKDYMNNLTDYIKKYQWIEN